MSTKNADLTGSAPQLVVTDNVNTYSWAGGTMSAADNHTVGLVPTDSTGTAYTPNRMYLSFTAPGLPHNPRIKKAELTLHQSAGTQNAANAPKLALYKVTEAITEGEVTPASGTTLIDCELMKTGEGTYTFDITSLIDIADTEHRLVVQLLDESLDTRNHITLSGADNSTAAPSIRITYKANYAVAPTVYTHDLGFLGQEYVDMSCGSVMLECGDFAWSGSRMPVTLRHLYNGNLASCSYTANAAAGLHAADYSAMQLGYGWRLNVMQSMVAASFLIGGASFDGYVFTDESGEQTFFKPGEEDGTYVALTDESMVYDITAATLTRGDETLTFDTGRLVKITDGSGNTMQIDYANGRITSVTDGIGRSFTFAYDGSGQLTGITAPDGTTMGYAYTSGNLTAVTYPDGRKATMGYGTGGPANIQLLDADGNNIYRIVNSFNNGKLIRIVEYGFENGTSTQGAHYGFSYSFAAREASVAKLEYPDTAEGETFSNPVITVYTFDGDWNVLSQYAFSSNQPNTGIESGSMFSDGSLITQGMGNNLLGNSSFEMSTDWSPVTENANVTCKAITASGNTVYGDGVMSMTSSDAAQTGSGVYQEVTVPAGSCTFSAYMRVMEAFSGTDAPGAYIRVVDASGNILGESEHLCDAGKDYIRLVVPFEAASKQTVSVQLLMDGAGSVYADACQLETNPFASDYNLLSHSSFCEAPKYWSKTGDVSYDSETCFTPGHSAKIVGNLDAVSNVHQSGYACFDRSVRETFTLSGWAKGTGIPARDRDGMETPTFRLRAKINYMDADYNDYSSEEFTADFSPVATNWQYASIQFSKSKYRNVAAINVYCDFDHNHGTVYFDNIQLVRNCIETGLTAEDFTEEDLGSDSEATTVEDTAESFEELVDTFGNALTETTFTDGEFGTVYRSFGYDDKGNDLISETDARGNVTTYTVDPVTSRNTAVTDRCGNKTAYEYDTCGRTSRVISKDADDTQLADVSYTYDSFDELSAITRGDGMQYTLGYDAYHNLESIGITGKSESLVQYAYKPKNGRLKKIAYANGDYSKLTYNGLGQVSGEKWYDAADTLTAHYKYLYNSQGDLARSIDLLAKKEYTYIYDEGRLVQTTECDITLNADELVTAKEPVLTVRYHYDQEGRLSRKRLSFADGTERVIYNETDANDNTVVKFQTGTRTVTSHSKTDSFGRKVFEELQTGVGVVSRQFDYHAGKITDTHQAAGKVKSSPTTQLVSQITLSDGRTLSYEYDAEERITKITDSLEGTTEYTYDALGQLLTESVNGVTVNEMTYDSYGNIRSINGKTYTYGDGAWKDLLTGCGDLSITYDAQGNPTNYLGNVLTWEKGRQLKTYGTNSYTYNANGIRTSKTVGGVTHTYTLDGTRILKETWGGNTLIPLYDNEESVCGIEYNGMPYFFQKNLQGDIIGICDMEGSTLATYRYDAWGVCCISENAPEIAEINPYRYRGYYYDAENQFYYLQSRYYDPWTGRFINGDEAYNLGCGSSLQCFNLCAYAENNSINMTDETGCAAINAICAAIGAVAGWYFGDWFARQLGHFSGATYWAIRIGVIVGGAVIGWFAGSLISKLIATYLKGNPEIIFKIHAKLGVKGFKSAMEFFGINPFSLATSTSKFIALVRLFNTRSVTLSYSWAVKLFEIAKKYGYKVTLDSPHGGYKWHLHLSGSNGKLSDLHIQIVKSAWDYIKKLLK